jgi:zinc/manganese transport system ATP-binding protein
VNAVELAGVTLAYGDRVVLRDVSLAIRADEFVGVLGPNGSGKTTLLRALLGQVRPSAGVVRVLGDTARRGHPAIGYLPQVRQAPGSDARLTGWDFLASGINGHRWGWPRLDAASRRDLARVLELAEARNLAKRLLVDLSGGERQRLLLAQALLGRPRLLLLDEPLISLDLRHQGRVVELVRQVQQELQIAVLFTAHELNPLLGSIDRVLYLGQGQAALGSVEQVITGPVLSRLYGTPIEVVRLGSRIFVLSGDTDVQHLEHRHHVAV